MEESIQRTYHAAIVRVSDRLIVKVRAPKLHLGRRIARLLLLETPQVRFISGEDMREFAKVLCCDLLCGVPDWYKMLRLIGQGQ